MPGDGSLFSVWTWFEDDFHHCEGSGLDGKTAVEKVADFSRRPAALIGIIKKITVVDCDDYTVLLWEFGKGIVFPVAQP